MTSTSSAAAPAKVRLKTIALPTQHGGWGFWLEPTLLGLLLAPSLAGFALGGAGLLAFLTHQPLKLAVKDRLKGKRFPRTMWAERFALGYGAGALVLFLLALLTAPQPFVGVLLLALPFAALQLWHEFRSEGREAVAEFAGAVAFGVLAPAIVLLYGWQLLPALGLWFALVARSVTSILYVRARLRLEYGKTAALLPVVLGHMLMFGLLTVIVIAGLLPWTVLLALLILMLRAMVGLSSWRRPAKPKVIGFREIAFGLLVVLLIVAGISME